MKFATESKKSKILLYNRTISNESETKSCIKLYEKLNKDPLLSNYKYNI